MKRFMALLCAGVLTFSMGLTAFAAPSPSTPDIEQEVIDKVEEEIKDKVEVGGSENIVVPEDEVTFTDSTGKEVTVGGSEIAYTDKEGNTQTVKVADIKIEAAPEAVKTQAVEKAKTAAATIIAKTDGLESQNTKVSVNVMEVKFPENVKSVTMPFSLPTVKKGDSVIVLHQKADGTWEEIRPDAILDGKVVATFSSFSPIAFVTVSKVEATNNDNNNDDDDDDSTTADTNNDTTTTDGTKSPKTGETSAVPFVVVFAVAAVAVAAVAGKKAIN